LCNAEFTFWKRRHHCRNCGHVVCSDCSNKRFRLDHISVKPSRVCSRCFDYLHEREIRGGSSGRHEVGGGAVVSLGSAHTVGGGSRGAMVGNSHSASVNSMASHLSAPSGLIPSGMGPRKENTGLGAAGEELPSGWCIAHTESGEPYYFNEVSGDTTWGQGLRDRRHDPEYGQE
jgi:hypothetical protein